MICPHCLYDHARPPGRCWSCGRALGGETRKIPFVGRTRELALLDEQLDEVIKTRHPRIIGVMGPPRIGRSRLLEAFRARHDNAFSDVVAARGYVVPGGRLVDPYMPFGRLLHNCFGLDESTSPEARQEKVREAIKRLDPPDPQYAAEGLGTFLGLQVVGGSATGSTPSTPDERRRRAFGAFTWYIAERARRQPLALIVEQLSSATAEGLSLLAWLRANLRDCAMLMLVEVDHDMFPAESLFQQYGDLLLPVEPLGPEAVGELMMRVADRASPPPPNLLGPVYGETEGHPEAVLHAAAALTAHDFTPVGGLGWGVDADESFTLDFALTPEHAARRRLDALLPDDRECLQRAAVVGPVFWRGALIPLLRIDQGSRDSMANWVDWPDVDGLDEILQRAVDAGVVVEMPDARVDGDREYAFARPRERDILCTELPEEMLAPMHASVAQWMEYRAGDGGDVHLLQIADHYRAGGNVSRAAYYYIRAGQTARDRFANETAVEAFEQALALLDERDTLPLLDVCHALGALHAAAGRPERAEACFQKMLAHAWTLDHRAKAGAALNRLGRLLRDRCQFARAADLLVRGRDLFAAVSDAAGVAASIDDIGQVALLRGDRAEALELFEEALTFRRASGDERAVALSLTNLARWWRDAGERLQAELALDQALAIRTALEDEAGVLDTRLERAELWVRAGEVDLAMAESAASLDTARRIGNRGRTARALALSALILAERGDTDAAAERAMEAGALAEQLGDRHSRERSLRALAIARADRGENDGALAAVEQAARIARDLGDRGELALALRYAARLHAQQSGLDISAVAQASRDAGEDDEGVVSGGSIDDLIEDALDAAADAVPEAVLELDPSGRRALEAAVTAAGEAVEVLDALDDRGAAAEARLELADLLEARGEVVRGRRVRAEAESRMREPG